jgi:hypothetical protein
MGSTKQNAGIESREYKAAVLRARAALERQGQDPEAFTDAIRLFAQAVDDAAVARRVWVAEGKPLTTPGGSTGRVDIPSPILKAVQDADKIVHAYAKPLGLDPTVKRAPGRPAGSSSAPDRPASGEPPRVTRLKAVE